MKKTIALFTSVTFFTTVLFEGSALAMPLGSTGNASGNAVAQLGQISESAGAVQSFQADLFTGRAQTSVPIFVPPGRKNVQPSLALSYSSSGGNGWLGLGWGLDLGFIQRDVKRGVPNYSDPAVPGGDDSTDKFVFSYQGVYSELVSVGANEYRAKDEALFLKFVFVPDTNSWIVTDKSGTKHTFGSTTDSRQTNALGTFKWALSEVKDMSTNYMSIAYTSDGGEIYLSAIEYNGNSGQSFGPTHKVEFVLEDRNDDTFSYLTRSKVELNKRLKEINVKVKVSGTYQLARKYNISYEYSPSSSRSRLKTVTECGTDGTTCLPPTTFNYQDKILEFESMQDIPGVGDSTYIASWSDHGEQSYDLSDMNGDGLTDRIYTINGSGNWRFQAQSGASLSSYVSWGTVETRDTSAAGFIRYTGEIVSKSKAELFDLNADGRLDRILAIDGNTVWKVQYNNGSGFDTSIDYGIIERRNNATAGDYMSYTSDHGETFTELMDMNGDGLADRILAEPNNTVWKVQWNTGTGFSTQESFGNIERRDNNPNCDFIRYGSDHAETVVDLADLNGDGLPDRILSSSSASTVWKVQWNTGKGFTAIEDYGPIESAFDPQSGDRKYIRVRGQTSGVQQVDLFDIDGDGLADRVQANAGSTVWKVQYNTGKGFTSLSDYGTIQRISSGASSYDHTRYIDSPTVTPRTLADIADFNGDGLVDRIQAISGNATWKLQKNKGPYPDLLKEIDNGRGGKTQITYTPSTSYDNTDGAGKHRLPFPVQLVSQVAQLDGMGNTYTTAYSYKGGMYEGTSREFRGFREVTVTDAVGTQTIHTFGQDDHNKGKLLQKEVKDSFGNLFSKEATTWNDTHPYTGVHFVFVSEQNNYLYDGDATYKQTRQTFTYDAHGNLASTTEEGDTSISTDSRKTVNTYVYNTTDYILNTLSKTTLYDTDLTTIKAERYFYYDGSTSLTTAPMKGLLTKEEEWLNTATGCGTPGVCTNNPKTTMTYDLFGNVATVVDARGYTTTNTYDTTYKLFLLTIQNPATHTRQFTYDAKLAQILTSTDQNSQVTETQYDVLGRVTKVIAPLDSSTEPTQEFVYEYPNLGTCGSTCVTKTTTKVKSSVPGQTFTQLITYSFSDGLGREIQRRSPAEDPLKQIVSGIAEFNSRGLVSKQYTPYFENTATSYQTPVTSGPKATFTYDAIGRRTRIDYPDGTNSNVTFNDFVKTTTDQRGKQLRYTNDAYGRLITVEEFNAGNTYTTTYEYDVLNNLKKTTDNSYNLTLITYDSLSRKTGMTDPDMGTWSYAYDLNDNLTSQTDAKNVTITFTYDNLNRVTKKDLPVGETDVIYQYDIAPTSYVGQTGYWIGRLDKVTDASGTHEFLYDKQGRVLKDKKTISGTGYEFVRTYDSMGRVRTLTYPDTEVVTYTYNGFGDVETISGVKSAVTTDYIKDVNYNPSGQITFTKYGNNVTSDYTYDSNTLCLNNIFTKKPDGTTKLQDLSYTFDNNGNVSSISDLVNSMSQSFTYDDLNRLLTATGSAYGSQSFIYDSIGNMTNKAGRTMTYGAGAAGPHAVTEVTASSGQLPTFCNEFTSMPLAPCTMQYDANGNMTKRGSDTLIYTSENYLKTMKTYEGATGSHTITLKPGWNVISFTYLPQDKSVSNIMSGLVYGTDYDQISTWDSALGSWRHWVNDPNFNDFTTFEYGKSYEIYNKTAVNKTLSITNQKSPAVNLTQNIKVGDNFISPAVKSATNITTVLTGLTLGTHYSDVKRFNSTTQVWESYAAAQFTQFEPGKGYNIIGLQNSSFSYGKTETTTTFTYDSTGARVKKVVGSTTTTYLGKDYEKEGSVTTKHIFLGDRRITTKKSSGTIEYIHSDHINSSNIITDASGNQSGLLEYDPYGSTVTKTGSANPKHKYTGKENDDSTKLYYYEARYYDSQIGRFITADPTIQNPTDPQDLNRYAYARNNPIKYNDPTGFGFKKFFKRFFGLIAGALAAVVCGVCGILVGNVIHGALNGGLKGALLGALASAGFMIPGAGILTMSVMGGLTTGLSSQLGGGSFVQGFAGGAVSGLMAGVSPVNLGQSPAGIFATEVANDFTRGFATGTISSLAGAKSFRESFKEGLYSGLFSAAYGQVNNVLGHAYGMATSGGLPKVKDGKFVYESKWGNKSALSLGNTVSYNKEGYGNGAIYQAPAYKGKTKAPYTVWEHELGHYPQNRALGAAYVPVHIASQAASLGISAARGEPPSTHRYNAFERGPFHKTPDWN